MSLPKKIKTITVNSFSAPVGLLTQPSHFEFNYLKDTAPSNPISLTMMVQNTPYIHGKLHPVFTQNLPEGYVRVYLHKKLERFASVNDMYLLALQGHKGIGHLTYDSDMPASQTEHYTLSEILNWDSEHALFPMLLDRYYLGGALSGMQPKIMVPLNARSTVTQNEVIVKSFDDEFHDLAINEFVCMSAAKYAGLNPPNFWLSKDKSCFVIERFDIQNKERLAIEDFSVLMGKERYASSYEQFLKAVWIYTNSQQELEKAYHYIVFNCLIGNGDAHLKNFALQYSQGAKNIRLTPPYDITHTLIYDTIDNNMALKMNGLKQFPCHDDLSKLGTAHKIKNSEAIIENTALKIEEYLDTSEEHLHMNGLKESILKSLNKAKTGNYTSTGYRRDQQRKFD